MKLRIRGNSLRLRLTKSEVEEFGTAGKVTDAIEFGGQSDQKLAYSLISSEGIERIDAHFGNGRIAVLVPLDIASQWTQTEQVGFGTEEGLRILVEKDFACLTKRPHEDESDNFPHPEENGAC